MATEKLKVYCPTHQSVFEVDRKPQIICEIREHALSNNFPDSEFWEFCCDCQTFSPGNFGTGGKARNACPHCERSTTRRFLCGECKTVSDDSDEDTKGKTVCVSDDKGIAPHCPGCGKSSAAAIYQHDCTDIEGTLLTSRKDCPFCQKSIVNKPPPAPVNMFSTEATATKPAGKSVSTQCPKCGNWGIAERPHCGKCGTRINDFGDGGTPGSSVPRMQLLGSICPNCGAGNDADGVFCHNCGQALKVIRQVERLDDINRQDSYSTGSIYSTQPPVAPFESPPITYQPTKNSSSNLKLIEFAVGGLLLFGAIIGLLVAVNSNNPKDNSANYGNSSNNSKQANSTNVKRQINSNGAVMTNSGSSPSLVGRKGWLKMNLNIRSASNKYAEILGTHYQNARVEVLDSESYSTPEGYATWYKVKVLKDGCDQVKGYCGNNWERNDNFGWLEAEKEGWMNAKYIVLE